MASEPTSSIRGPGADGPVPRVRQPNPEVRKRLPVPEGSLQGSHEIEDSVGVGSERRVLAAGSKRPRGAYA